MELQATRVLARPLRRFLHQISPLASIAITSFSLGVAFSLGVVFVLLFTAGFLGIWALSLGCYLIFALVLFHFGEFVTAAQLRPFDATPEAFMIYHSDGYVVAVIAAIVEFSVELILVDSTWKLLSMTPMSVCCGCVMSVFFYGIRLVGIVHCGSNFSLRIEYQRRKEHVLVKDGIYRYLRHPAYFGWFYYALSTQIVLMNPICLVLYAVASWLFFHERIQVEEDLLSSTKFFGQEYDKYKKGTFIGIPFI